MFENIGGFEIIIVHIDTTIYSNLHNLQVEITTVRDLCYVICVTNLCSRFVRNAVRQHIFRLPKTSCVKTFLTH